MIRMPKNLAVDKNESFAGVIILRGQVYNASCKMKQFNQSVTLSERSYKRLNQINKQRWLYSN